MVNWAAIAAITSLFGVLATIIGTAYTAGQMREKIKNNSDRLDVHDDRLDKHAAKLEEHGENIGRLQEWRSGFNAAARVSGNRETP
jgi:threonine dehydratase